MSGQANDDLVGEISQLIDVVTERIVDQLHEAAGLDGEALTQALANEKRLSRSRRSLEKARHCLTEVGAHADGEETLP